MDANGSANTSDLLAKLNRLEEQVSSLSSQLAVKKKKISQLNLTVKEQQAQISDLDEALVFAQKSLLDRLLEKIQHYQQQVKHDIDEKAINPAVTQIQQQLQTIQEIVNSSKDYITKRIVLVQDNVRATSDVLQQWPVKTKAFLEKDVVERYKLQVNQLQVTLLQYVETMKDQAEQDILKPIMNTVKKIPGQCQALYQGGVIDPSRQLFNLIYDYSGNGFEIIKKSIAGTLDQGVGLVEQTRKFFLNLVQDFIEKYSHGGLRSQQMNASHA